jgi:hypothetical protein
MIAIILAVVAITVSAIVGIMALYDLINPSRFLLFLYSSPNSVSQVDDY